MSGWDSTAIPRWFNLPAAVLLGLAAALPAAAQPGDTRSPSGPGFVEVVNVEVVNVDVYVTDADGKPVLGLGPDDFELRVDGRAVPISNFYAVEQQGDELLVRRGGELTAEPLLPPPPEDPLERAAAARRPVTVPPEQALRARSPDGGEGERAPTGRGGRRTRQAPRRSARAPLRSGPARSADWSGR